MQTKTRTTIIAGLFTTAVMVASFVGFSGNILHSVDTTTKNTKHSSGLAFNKLVQTASAASQCSGFARDVNNDGNCERSSSVTYTITLSPDTNDSPTASCSLSPDNPTTETDITYDGSASSDDGSITNYDWDLNPPTSNQWVDLKSGPNAVTGTYPKRQIYVPGEYKFRLTVTDNKDDTDSVTCPTTVTQPLNAVNDSYSTPMNQSLQVSGDNNLLSNDSPDGGNLQTSIVSEPGHDQAFTLNSQGDFQYTPQNNFTGTDTFEYEASDGNGNTDQATVTITVEEPSFSIQPIGGQARVEIPEGAPVESTEAALSVSGLGNLPITFSDLEWSVSTTDNISGGNISLQPRHVKRSLDPSDKEVSIWVGNFDTNQGLSPAGDRTITLTASAKISPNTTVTESVDITVDVLSSQES